MLTRRSLLFRILAAAATFSVAGAVVAALTVSAPADAKGKGHSEELAILEPTGLNPPPAPAKKAPEKVKPHSTAQKFLPVHHFGGY